MMFRELGDSTVSVLFSGGMAGIFSWLVTYPQDVIKTRIQADGYGGNRYVGGWRSRLTSIIVPIIVPGNTEGHIIVSK